MNDSSDILAVTLSGLERGLTVGHIASRDLMCCEWNAPVAEVYARPELEGFDHIPVKRDGHIIGVFDRRGPHRSGTAAERMRTLDGSQLVSEDQSLLRFLPEMCHSEYWLVVGGAGIAGIVTRSDVHKLPVRVLAFCLLTHLESVMAELISKHYGADEDGWLRLLSPPRVQKIEATRNELKSKRFDPPTVELTQFADKRTIVRKTLGLGNAFKRELEQIEELRNTVAHAGSYTQNRDKLNEFIWRLQLAEKWIKELRTRIPTGDAREDRTP